MEEEIELTPDKSLIVIEAALPFVLVNAKPWISGEKKYTVVPEV